MLGCIFPCSPYPAGSCHPLPSVCWWLCTYSSRPVLSSTLSLSDHISWLACRVLIYSCCLGIITGSTSCHPQKWHMVMYCNSPQCLYSHRMSCRHMKFNWSKADSLLSYLKAVLPWLCPSWLIICTRNPIFQGWGEIATLRGTAGPSSLQLCSLTFTLPWTSRAIAHLTA